MPNRVNCVSFAALSCVLVLEPRAGVSQPIQVSPTMVQTTARADTVFSGVGAFVDIGIATAFGMGKMPYKFVRAAPTDAGAPDIDFVIVSPSSGTAPTAVSLALNPSVVPYMPSGNYDRTVFFAPADDPSSLAPVIVTLHLVSPGPPSIASVLGAATVKPTISPGELVSIFGAHLSTPPINGQLSNAGLYPTTLGNTMVTFNGIAAPLLYVSAIARLTALFHLA